MVGWVGWQRMRGGIRVGGKDLLIKKHGRAVHVRKEQRSLW